MRCKLLLEFALQVIKSCSVLIHIDCMYSSLSMYHVGGRSICCNDVLYACIGLFCSFSMNCDIAGPFMPTMVVADSNATNYIAAVKKRYADTVLF